jgi:hypothetical protein
MTMTPTAMTQRDFYSNIYHDSYIDFKSPASELKTMTPMEIFINFQSFVKKASSWMVFGGLLYPLREFSIGMVINDITRDEVLKQQKMLYYAYLSEGHCVLITFRWHFNEENKSPWCHVFFWDQICEDDPFVCWFTEINRRKAGSLYVSYLTQTPFGFNDGYCVLKSRVILELLLANGDQNHTSKIISTFSRKALVSNEKMKVYKKIFEDRCITFKRDFETLALDCFPTF